MSALAVALAIAMCVLDASIANVALPAMVTAFDAPASTLVWVVNAYQLTILAALLPLAALGEAVGFRRVYGAGLAVFLIGSLACALSTGPQMLIAARVLQGLGAAGIMGINAALVRHTYPAALLGRGVGLNALVVATASAAGPAVAGVVLSAASWPWLFALNLPLGLAALLLGMRVLPTPAPSRRALDWTAAGLNAAALGLLVLGVDRGVHGHAEGWLAAALGLGAGVLLVRRSRRRTAPLVPLDLLARRPMALSIGLVSAAFVAHTLAMVGLPFLMHDTLGLPLVSIGVLMTAWPLATAAAALVSGRLTGRVPSGLLGTAGMGLFAAGLGAWALTPPDADLFALVAALAACGAGFGLFQSPNTRDILLAAPPGRSGGASGLTASGRLAGQTVGAALAGALFHLTGDAAARAALALAVAFALLGAAISLARLRDARPQRDRMTMSS